MNFEKHERYEISYAPDGLQISTWRALPNLGFGLFTLLLSAACCLTDPYPGHTRIWAGLGILALAVVACFGVRVESWIVSETTLRYKGSHWRKGQTMVRPQGVPLRIHVERLAPDLEGYELPFPYVVHFLTPGGANFGDAIQFREEPSVERLLGTLRETLPIEVSLSGFGLSTQP